MSGFPPPFFPPFINQNRTATDLLVGQTPPTAFPFSIEIDGSTIGSLNQIDNTPDTPTDPKKKLNLKLNDGAFQFANTSNILSDNAFSLLKTIAIQNKDDLIWIANEYEKGGRQFYNFFYDIVALVRMISKLPEDFQKLLKIKRNADILMHNRVLAELSYLYLQRGHTVKLEQKRGESVPDLLIDNQYGELKTIISPKTNEEKSYLAFANTLKDKREEALQQVGEDGIIFISPWSGIINSLFYTFFYEMKINKTHDFDGWEVYTSIPPLQKGKTIMVIATPTAFVDYYLVFDTQWILDSIYLFANSRYKIINMLEPMAYMKITNPVRKGFVVGEQGSRGISFLTG